MNPLLDSRSMRFKPWMLAPRSKATAGPWNALPPPALAALTSAHPSPMVRGYLLNGSWPGASGVRPSFAAPEPNQEPEPPTDIRPEPKQEAEPPTNTQPEPPPEPRAKAETSSLSLTIRVVGSKARYSGLCFLMQAVVTDASCWITQRLPRGLKPEPQDLRGRRGVSV